MQKVIMLKTLPGVPAGEIYPRIYEEGKEYEINDSLVLGFMEQGGCEIIGHALPKDRETKVDGPKETKPGKPLSKMSKAELVTHAKTRFGLELAPDNMTAKDMIAEIEKAAAAKDEGAAA